MKKLAILFALVLPFTIAKAQISVPKEATSVATSFVKPPAIGDIGKTTSGITDLLGSKLSLPADQTSKLSGVISSFLGEKKGIIGLADKDPTGYLAKFNPLQKGLFSKMKGIMGATAFTKFLGMKPSGKNIAGNLLSNLFF
jgi:hypothetical protein